MAASDATPLDFPQQADLDRCVHCGLCLNACPTYRELRVEMDSPRGRIYQMAQVANGAPVTTAYAEHIDLCLACRGCETACPSGVQYGRLVEAARAQIETTLPRPWRERLLRDLVFRRLLPSRAALKTVAAFLFFARKSGLERAAAVMGLTPKRVQQLAKLAPEIEFPSFYGEYGKVLPAFGEQRFRVAFLGGCIANVSFARLNDTTVSVLRRNGCEVWIPAEQGCCGALHVHAGLREQARVLARRNIDALLGGDYDAIITNAAGCGSTLKEYDELLEHDPAYAEKSARFSGLMRDVTEFLAALKLNRDLGPVPGTVTYQDSCHLAHGQKIRNAPRDLLGAIPGLQLREMAMADLCCGSAGIYNVLHTDMSMALLDQKMGNVKATGAQYVATANPGCMLQLRAGVERTGGKQEVVHLVELLEKSYLAYETANSGTPV